MLAEQGHRRQSRAGLDQPRERRRLLGTAAADREQEGVHRPLPDQPDGLGNRLPGQDGEAATPRRLHPDPLVGGQDRRARRGARGGTHGHGPP